MALQIPMRNFNLDQEVIAKWVFALNGFLNSRVNKSSQDRSQGFRVAVCLGALHQVVPNPAAASTDRRRPNFNLLRAIALRIESVQGFNKHPL
jgi:hypothetical protein